MGMYTELMIKCLIKNNIDVKTKEVLDYLFNNGKEPSVLPDHAFFKCARWQDVGTCGSHYHIPWATSRYAEGYLFTRSDFKNYTNEVDLFLGWLNPYLDHAPVDCIGWTWCEDDHIPTLIYYH